MNSFHLIAASLRHYWRAHLGVILGAALGAMVILGALIVGDSVRETLAHLAMRRIGGIDHALFTGDRFFRQSLAHSFDQLTPDGKEVVAPAILLPGSVTTPDGSARANQVQILGITPKFAWLAPTKNLIAREDLSGLLRHGLAGDANWPADGLAINETLARRLNVTLGDTITLRVESPGTVSRDAPLSGSRANTVAIRGTVARIVGAPLFGHFSLRAGHRPAGRGAPWS